MKRKKWSEVEEQTLLSKYSELSKSGTLSKLKTREKKFKPIAEHVNSLHHLRDPITFPFRWSWRDVSIKVQNMRHQYLGVKQKIRISDNEFNWEDGEIHWENFLKYKEVFGDIELSDFAKEGNNHGNSVVCGVKSRSLDGILGGSDDDEDDEEGSDEEDDEIDGCDELGLADDRVAEINCVEEGKEKSGFEHFVARCKKKSLLKRKRSLRMVGNKVLELRDLIRIREEKRQKRDWIREEEAFANETARLDRDTTREIRLREREDEVRDREIEFEEMWLRHTKLDVERWKWFHRRLEEERRERMKLEEKRVEEEMVWREKVVEMQIEHEKQMIQLQAEACHNQLQLLGAMARLFCQFFGSASDGLGGGLGTIPNQFMQSSQHQVGGLGDDGEKPDSTSPSEFL